MKHQNNAQRSRFAKTIAIANIMGNLRKGEIIKAEECAKIGGIGEREFEYMKNANLERLTASQIYDLLF